MNRQTLLLAALLALTLTGWYRDRRLRFEAEHDLNRVIATHDTLTQLRGGRLVRGSGFGK